MKLEIWIGKNVGIIIDKFKLNDVEKVLTMVFGLFTVMKKNKKLITESVVFQHLKEDDVEYVG